MEPGEYISNVFLRPKKDGSFQLILDLKESNKNVYYNKFKMESLQNILELVEPLCYMTSMDFDSAFLIFPVSPVHQKFLKFYWKQQLYKYTCMPFRLTSAPHLFTKLLKPPVAYLHSLGAVMVMYLDDSLQSGHTYEE